MLVVCIFASALGALIMRLLVLRAGFTPIDADPARADQDVLITRLGHAAAGVCFATTAILATVLVARTPAPRVVASGDPKMSERLTALDRDRQALGEQVNALDATVKALHERWRASSAACRRSAVVSIRTSGARRMPKAPPAAPRPPWRGARRR